MHLSEIETGAVVRKKSGQPFRSLAAPSRYTTKITKIQRHGMSETLDRVWFDTGKYLLAHECVEQLELLTPAAGDVVSIPPAACPQVSTSGQTPSPNEELTGGSVNYYKALVENPTSGGDEYELEVNDFIEAFGLNFAEGNIVKAIARLAQLRREAGKPGSTSRYEAEKQHFFAERVLEQNP